MRIFNSTQLVQDEKYFDPQTILKTRQHTDLHVLMTHTNGSCFIL